jgi:glutamyl-tRNA synthetase
VGRRGARSHRVPRRRPEDFVILRSDRTPIYNFAVVDDHDMAITTPAETTTSRTPEADRAYQALGWELPVFGHVPMINGPDGKKLSKRHGATAVGDYQHRGILPAAMRNFLALLGWSPGGDREIMTLEQMIELFTLEGVQKKAAVFDTTKLEWMNGQYLSAMTAEELAPVVEPQLAALGVRADREAVLRAIGAVKTRSRTTLDVARQVVVRLDGARVVLDDKATKEIAKDPAEYRAALEASTAALAGAEWTAAGLEHALRALAETRSVPAGKVFQPIRIALTGGTVSEPVNELLVVVGKEQALQRLSAAARAVS